MGWDLFWKFLTKYIVTRVPWGGRIDTTLVNTGWWLRQEFWIRIRVEFESGG